MIYFLALLPATALTVAGYVALFLASRSEGTLRAFGKYLGFWAFTLAGLVILGAIFAAAHGHRGHGPGPGFHGMHRGMFQPWPQGGCPPPPPPPPAPGTHSGEAGAAPPGPGRPAPGPAPDSSSPQALK